MALSVGSRSTCRAHTPHELDGIYSCGFYNRCSNAIDTIEADRLVRRKNRCKIYVICFRKIIKKHKKEWQIQNGTASSWHGRSADMVWR